MSDLEAPLLEVRDLQKQFHGRGSRMRKGNVRTVYAVSGVSFDLWRGEVLSLVGESGCGKSTTARCLLRLLEPTGGSVKFEGRDVLAAGRTEMRQLRHDMQMVFQDPYGSLNPRLRVGDIVSEPLIVQGLAKKDAMS
ncbi:MAG: ATP-binding cassette domain-containing protein, partial [Acidobacteriota bacterium]